MALKTNLNVAAISASSITLDKLAEAVVVASAIVSDYSASVTNSQVLGAAVAKTEINKKANLVTSATAGNIAELTATGDIKDSGVVVSGLLHSSDIVDNVTTSSTDKALSANMGKELQDQITNLQSRGRFLSNWNSATGKPTTDPTTLPYSYRTGDYYIVGNVATGSNKNYKPTGAQYTGAASTTEETDTVAINDTYIYDGSKWMHLQGAQREVTFASVTGSPYDNTNLSAALTSKVTVNDPITAGTATKITYDAKGLVTAGANLSADDIPSLTLAKISDVTATAAEVNYLSGVTSAVQSQIDSKVAKNSDISAGTATKITYDAKGLVTAGANLSADDIPSLTLAKISDVTATAAEVNVLDGVTVTTAEINALSGVLSTSTIQAQINTKQNIANLVTAFASGSGQSDSKYPSEKLVYDTIKSNERVVAEAINELETTKQDVITDLSTIRSGASAGATAVQSVTLSAGTSNGTVVLTVVKGSATTSTSVSVTGLGTAAYKSEEYFIGTSASTSASDTIKGAKLYTDAKVSAIESAITSNYVTKTTQIAGVSINTGIEKSALLSAINVEDGAQVNIIESVKVNGSALAITSKAVNVLVTTGSANGTISVNGSDVTVKGLDTAAYKSEGYFIGTSADTSASDTIWGAKKYADAQISAQHTSDQAEFVAKSTQIAGISISDGISTSDLRTAVTVLDGVKVNGSALTIDSSKMVDVLVTTGSANGHISVNGADVKVKGIDTAAYKAESYFATATAFESHVSNSVAHITAEEREKWNRGGVETTTYSALASAVASASLVLGRQYRITDYVTAVPSGSTEYVSAGHAFDLIVTANSTNTLDENARVALHDGDTYFAGSKMSAWEVKYAFTNDTVRFGWADASGKGVIYYMKDEFGNVAPYDFKNIMFKRTLDSTTGLYSTLGGDKAVYTFSSLVAESSDADVDASLDNAKNIDSNIIMPYYDGSVQKPNNVVLFGTNNRSNYICSDVQGVSMGPGYCSCNRVESGVNAFTLYAAADNSKKIQNYDIKSSVRSASKAATRDLTYDTCVAKDSEGTLKEFCIADLMA